MEYKADRQIEAVGAALERKVFRDNNLDQKSTKREELSTKVEKNYKVDRRKCILIQILKNLFDHIKIISK